MEELGVIQLALLQGVRGAHALELTARLRRAALRMLAEQRGCCELRLLPRSTAGDVVRASRGSVAGVVDAQARAGTCGGGGAHASRGGAKA